MMAQNYLQRALKLRADLLKELEAKKNQLIGMEMAIKMMEDMERNNPPDPPEHNSYFPPDDEANRR